MDMLFSPWRSVYMDTFKDKKEDCKCIFCEALAGNQQENNSLIIKKNIHTYSMLNLFPYNSGHLMIIPNRHLCNFSELNSEETAEMMSESSLMMKALTAVIHPQGFNMGMNIGKAAGAGIDTHLHLHIVPRWIGDTNFMPALGEVKIISQDLIDLRNKLIEALKSL